MSTALYRKYRPQTFAELVGQGHITTTIQRELETDKAPHAYLFSGPRGLGKTTIARLIAKAVNCQKRKKGESEPCNECDSCKSIIAGNAMDVIEIDAASHTGVDNVRENIIANARFTPSNSPYKVFIIDEVHMLSTSAFNALLKTLEEPPSHALFILATTEIHKIPETIISRCQRFDFRRVSHEALLERLMSLCGQEKRKVDTAVLETIIQRSGGGVRDAESLLGQVLSIDAKTITAENSSIVLPVARHDEIFELLMALSRNDAASGLTTINNLVQQGIGISQFTSDALEILRFMLLAKVDSKLTSFAVVLAPEAQKKLLTISQDFTLGQLSAAITRFLQAQQELKFADIIQLPLELAIVELCVTEAQKPTTPAPTFVKKSPEQLTKSGDSDNTSRVAATIIKKPADQKSGAITAATKKSVKKITLTLDQIHEGWERVLAAVKDYNQSLASTLRHHRPTAIDENGLLEIAFKYSFYEQRLVEVKNKIRVEEILEAVFEAPLRIKTIIVKELPGEVEEKPAVSGEELKSLTDLFGGQVVD